MQNPLVWIIIGVAGCGKTSIGRLLADRLECDFIEGDRRHPLANVAKMANGVALTDADRAAWLNELTDEARRASAAGRELVISCSALKRAYRNQLNSGSRVQMVLPVVPQDVLFKRLLDRPDHYMKQAMLESQIAAFEHPAQDEQVWELDGLIPLNEFVKRIVERRVQEWPKTELPWWRR